MVINLKRIQEKRTDVITPNLEYNRDAEFPEDFEVHLLVLDVGAL